MDVTADTIGLQPSFVSTNTEMSPSPFTPQFPPPWTPLPGPTHGFSFSTLSARRGALRSPTQKTGKVSLTNASPGVLGLASKSNTSEMGHRLLGDGGFPRVRKPRGQGSLTSPTSRIQGLTWRRWGAGILPEGHPRQAGGFRGKGELSLIHI